MPSRAARAMLALGAAAGPLYIVLAVGQILMREGFDMRQHAVSLLSNGELGWIQVLNFLLSGALVAVGAIGCRQVLRGSSGGTWAPLLLGVFGIGLIGSGLFSADPALGFPPDSETPAEVSLSGLLHFVFGGIGFFAVIGACFVFARRYSQAARKGLAWWSATTGALFLLAFAGVASGTQSAAIMISFYVAVAWLWTWLTFVLTEIRGWGKETKPKWDARER